jgi:uncharacterized protein (TIGR02284 family)
MKTEIRNVTQVLNGLLKINTDRIEGYQNAAGGTCESDLKTIFTSMADESKKNASALIREINKSGGETVVMVCPVCLEGTSKFSGKHPKAIRDSCEFGIDAQTAYLDAISFNELTTVARNMVRNQQVAMKVSFDFIKNFREGNLPLISLN